jgi:hypothetical protein
MLAKLKTEFKNVCNLYHLLNVLFSLAFPLAKIIPQISLVLFGTGKVGLDTASWAK